MTKRKQATSKLVECSICSEHVHARGLHGHMKLKHGIILGAMTRVNPTDSSRPFLTQVKKTNDLSQHIKVNTSAKSDFQTFEDTETKWWDSRLGYRIRRFEYCYKCDAKIELQVPVKLHEWFGSKQRKVVCDRCITNFYGLSDCLVAHYRYNKYGEEIYWLRLWRKH